MNTNFVEAKMSEEKQEEFLKYYRPVHDRFERFCRARTFGDSDYRDLMNDTLVVAYSKFDQLENKSAFLSFLFSICVRIVGNQLQKKKDVRLNEQEHQSALATATSEDIDVIFLHQALSQLKEKVRECIILFEISGFKIKEIADIQKSSEAAVKKRLTRGREQLKLILTESSIHKSESHG